MVYRICTDTLRLDVTQHDTLQHAVAALPSPLPVYRSGRRSESLSESSRTQREEEEKGTVAHNSAIAAARHKCTLNRSATRRVEETGVREKTGEEVGSGEHGRLLEGTRERDPSLPSLARTNRSNTRGREEDGQGTAR